MTSRERILTALNHQVSDRVPVDFSGHRSSGIAAMAYARLREFLGLPRKPIRVYDPVQQLAIVDEDVLTRFRVDTIELGRAFAREDHWWTEWTLPDGTPCLMPVWAKPEWVADEWVLRSARTGRVIAQMPDGVWYFEQAHFPFLEHEDLDQLEAEFSECMWSAVASPPGPIVAGPDGAERLAAGARQFPAESDFFKVIISRQDTVLDFCDIGQKHIDDTRIKADIIDQTFDDPEIGCGSSSASHLLQDVDR